MMMYAVFLGRETATAFPVLLVIPSSKNFTELL